METVTRRGRFISIEGVEGAGKTTVARMLRDALSERLGVEVMLRPDPGGEPLSEQIRQVLLDPSSDICATSELFLFLAARSQAVDSVIRPALRNGIAVISDRYTDSTLAYQGYGRGLNVDRLRMLCDFAVGGLRPGRTIVLDVPVEVGLARQGIADRIGGEGAEFHRRVREGYLALAREEPGRITVVDATKDKAEVFERALAACEAVMRDG